MIAASRVDLGEHAATKRPPAGLDAPILVGRAWASHDRRCMTRNKQAYESALLVSIGMTPALGD